MKRKIMNRAWELAREGQKKFGGKVSEYIAIALKIAWKEAKEGAMENNQLKLKGTPKQVAWAKDIRKNVIPKIDRVLKAAEQWANEKRGRAKAYARALEIYEEMKKNDDASFWIETFAYRFTHTEIIYSFENYIERIDEKGFIITQKLHKLSNIATSIDLDLGK